MGLEIQGSKPTGNNGIFMGRIMNLFHTGLYKRYYNRVLPSGSIKLLDIGCGGGRFIKYLANKHPDYKLAGIDHSPEMVELSGKVNRQEIKNGRVEIINASVTELPYNNETMDIVTANETVQFWPDIEKSFAEIFRILTQGGNFIIYNRYPSEGTKWWKIAKLKSSDDFYSVLEKAGFKHTEIDLASRKAWIIVKSEK